MEKSTGSTQRVPRSYCIFCEEKTPHLHERLAVNRIQVIRSLCLTCNREQPREQTEPRP
jgi:hypothetical protein